MLKSAVKILTEYIGKNAKIAVAVSGGEDSVALAHLVFSCGIFDKKNITLIHVNHNLRGKNSLADEGFVRTLARENNVGFTCESVDVAALVAAKGYSVEQAARELRYEVFYRLKNSVGADCVLTAHHAFDNAETVLMNMFRGCGLSGLKGMDILSGGWLLRPFLNTDKDEIKVYIKAHNLPFRTDESNTDSSYSRNYLRGEIMPLILKRWGGAVKGILNLSVEARDALEILNAHSQDVITLIEGGGVKIDPSAISQNGAQNGALILEGLKKAGAYNGVSRENIKAVAELKNSHSGTGVDLDGGFRAVREYDAIVVYKPCKKDAFTEAVFKTGEIFIGSAQVIIEECELKVPFNLRSQAKITERVLSADLNKIPSSAVFRQRHDGDTFTPFGGGGKKLKKYLIDKKIPMRLRENLIVLADGNEVLAVLGVEISDKIKLAENSRAVALKVKYSK